ncbi:unnamed protein product [Adineta steineri]|uniref:F-box domain-containing protein n=1 Tax=Adineta steineri TaxID=433720 RepID=A0A819AK08_9BILA|nr:unnamed protein product [Adineta steineri]
MNFETLSNELLLDIFEYLPAIDLLRAFYQLNNRFDNLLFIHYKTYHLDFRSISKGDFHIFCQRYLPRITDRIISITLSDDNETPDAINSFLSYGISFYQLISLRSIKIYHFHSTILMNRLMTECHQLPYLTHLNFINCRFQNEHQSISTQLNNLWMLPKLISCHMDIYLRGQADIIHPLMISTSLQSLSTKSYSYGWKQLNHLLQQTPSLRHLHIFLEDEPEDEQSRLFTSTSLVTLKISAYQSPITLTNLLKSAPNLYRLVVETDEINMNGYDWEELIINHLPRLKYFHLQMIFRLNDNDTKEQRVDNLLNSFRTQFWLVKHQWYIRCDWNRCEQCDKNNIYLYTLPYAFDYYFMHEPNFKSKSTCHADNDYSSYDNVHTIGYELIPTTNQILSFYRFMNLRHLNLYLPFDENFIIMIPKLDQLVSLSVAPYLIDDDSDFHDQLQTVLDRSPHLTSLKFQNWLLSKRRPPYEYSNRSIHQLNLQDINEIHIEQWYNTEQCRRLIHSSLGKQCQILSIAVENRQNILELIHGMSNLRTLNVLCQDDILIEKENNSSLTSTDEFIDWLQQYLPSTCTIIRDNDTIKDKQQISYKPIHLWI